MLDPAIGKLIEKSENRYKLVLEVAQTARDISEKEIESGEILVETPVSLAIKKMAAELD